MFDDCFFLFFKGNRFSSHNGYVREIFRSLYSPTNGAGGRFDIFKKNLISGFGGRNIRWGITYYLVSFKRKLQYFLSKRVKITVLPCWQSFSGCGHSWWHCYHWPPPPT